MRVFIAIPVSEAVKNYVNGLKNELDQNHPDVKWVERDNYHLTLKFLGEIDPTALDPIKERLRTIAESCPAFSLETKGLGFFPNRNRPRVVWAGIRGEMDKAEFLGERIDAYLSELGFDPEKKRSFHLTLGRVRSELGLEELQLKAAGATRRNEVVAFEVENFSLMESKLSTRGPSYAVLERFYLKG